MVLALFRAYKGQNKENFDKSQEYSSHKPLGGRKALSILGERRFKFVQIKSLGSCMAPPQGLKLSHSNI